MKFLPSKDYAKLYSGKVQVTAADVLNDKVLPFFESHMIPVMSILTVEGLHNVEFLINTTMKYYCSSMDIEHTRTKAKSPQTNGICERFHQTVLNEFCKPAFIKTFYKSVEQFQEDLDFFIL